jgi:anthranilate synthase/aminodeoxychorismate synthase-like glutamine amidotransferase
MKALRILVIDNYDSFTFNLVQLLGELGAKIEVVRNDEWSVAKIMARPKDGLLISPGPGRPEGAGVSMEVLRRLHGRLPMLGVCLGHQSLAAVHGGEVVGAEQILHGKTSSILHTGQGLFEGMGNPFEATRYHSLLVPRRSLPPELQVVAWTVDDEIMALRHREAPSWGVQFHPESILTHEGSRLMANFLDLCRGFTATSRKKTRR